MIFTRRNTDQRDNDLQKRIETLENAERCRKGNHKWQMTFESTGRYEVSSEAVALNIVPVLDYSKPYIACRHCGTRYQAPPKPKQTKR